MMSMVVLKPLDITIHDLYYILRALSVVPKKPVFMLNKMRMYKSKWTGFP